MMKYVTLLAALLLAGPALGQDKADPAANYPATIIKIIVCVPAGGGVDTITRIVADRLRQRLGQPVVIENRGGLAGNIGAEAVYAAEPDGYTLLASQPAPLTVNALLYKKLNFDPTAFLPVAIMTSIPNTLTVRPDFPAKTMQEFIAYGRANPDKLNFASQGTGTTSHLTAELFQLMAKVKLRFIPYRGSAPALQGLLAGDVDLMFDNLGVSLPLVEAGSLKLLAVASAQRLASLPDVPTIAETLPGFEAVAWYALVAPPGTPKTIIDKINADVNEALRQPDLADRLRKLSAETFGGSVEKTTTYLRDEVDRWGDVIKAADIKLQ
jgi:tripartite-type tricarboxylate transporter receptor subunit TctC